MTLFYNESDILELRLNILNPVVDKFVILEARKTFIGKEKPLNFDPVRFAKWKDKIVYHIIDEPTDEEWQRAKDSPNTGAGEHWWVREFCQKESMLKALEFCDDDDIVFISDLDEIWNPKILSDNWFFLGDKICRPIQTAYHYYLNNRSDQDINGWVGTRFATYKTVKRCGVNHLRTESMHPSLKIPYGGWHFTFCGGADKIKEKVENYGHQEYRPALSNVDQALALNVDFLNRGFKLWKDESELPEYILNNKDKWKHLLLA